MIYLATNSTIERFLRRAASSGLILISLWIFIINFFRFSWGGTVFQKYIRYVNLHSNFILHSGNILKKKVPPHKNLKKIIIRIHSEIKISQDDAARLLCLLCKLRTKMSIQFSIKDTIYNEQQQTRLNSGFRVKLMVFYGSDELFSLKCYGLSSF